MRSLVLGVCGLLALAVLGGALFLGFHDWPAPSRQMEVAIPHERLPLQ